MAIHQQPGPGASAAQQASTQARAAANFMDIVRAKGGAALKILNDFAGPLALASGAALAFAGAMARGLRQTELVQRGLEKIAKIQLYTPEFAKMLGGLGQARRRLEEIWRSPARKVFAFDDLAQGNKKLEILTGGLLSGKRGMKEIGDAAAAGGTSFNEMASIVGVLYDDLANGRPIGAAVQQLRMLGVISTPVADKLETLAASGAGFAAVWGAVHTEIRKSNGSMKTMEATIAGLQAKLSAAKDEQAKTVGEQFAEGEKAGLDAQIRATEAMTPVLKSVAVILGTVWSWWQKCKLAVVEFAASLPGVKGGLVGVLTGFAALIFMLAAFSVATTIQGIIALTASLYAWAAASSVAAGATGVFARAVLALGGVLRLALGPWGALIGLLSVVAGIMANAAIEAHTFGKAQEDLKKSVQETNQSLQDQVKQIQTQGEKSAAIGATGKEVVDAQDRLAQAEAEQRKAAADWNPLNDGGASDAVAERKKELEEARKTAAAAQNAPTDAAVESLMGDDYQAAKAQSEVRQRQLAEEAKKLQEQRAAVEALDKARAGSGGVADGFAIKSAQDRVNALGAGGKTAAQIAEEQRGVAQKQGAEANSFSKDNLDRLFNMQQAASQTRSGALREQFKATGDTDLRDQADKLDDEIFRKKRERDLLASGYSREDAQKQAGAENSLNQAIRERERAGTPQVSSLAAIGGSAGTAGLISEVPKQQLETLKAIDRKLKDLDGTVKRGVSDHNDDRHYE